MKTAVPARKLLRFLRIVDGIETNHAIFLRGSSPLLARGFHGFSIVWVFSDDSRFF
jgi:hypothetical protein